MELSNYYINENFDLCMDFLGNEKRIIGFIEAVYGIDEKVLEIFG